MQAEGPNGEKYFAEQTSHHPPVQNFMLEGEGYTYSGWFVNHCSINGLNSLGGWREGKLAFNFSDGGLYSISGGFMEFGGLAEGKIWTNFTKTMELKDHINGFVAEFEYQHQPDA